MWKRVGFVCFVAMLSSTAQAEPEHEIAPDGTIVPVVTREICTSALWGHDEVRTDCRLEVRPAAKANPALQGICTTYYGRRTCY
jgi:hypothetical protein